MNQKKIEQLKQNEKLLEMLDKEKFEQINENEKIKQNYIKFLEEENKKMDENNYNLIKFKLDNAMAIQTKQMDNYNQKYLYKPKIVLNSGHNVSDDQISSMVDQIMLKKKQENKYSFLDFENLEKEENNNNFDEINDNKKDKINDYKNINGIDLEIENKVNKLMEKYKNK